MFDAACTSDCLLLGQGACRDEAGVVCCPFFSSEGNCTNTSTVASYSTISSIDFGEWLACYLRLAMLITCVNKMLHKPRFTAYQGQVNVLFFFSFFICLFFLHSLKLFTNLELLCHHDVLVNSSFLISNNIN